MWVRLKALCVIVGACIFTVLAGLMGYDIAVYHQDEEWALLYAGLYGYMTWSAYWAAIVFGSEETKEIRSGCSGCIFAPFWLFILWIACLLGMGIIQFLDYWKIVWSGSDDVK